MINKIKKHIKHYKMCAELTSYCAKGIYENGQIFDAFMMTIATLCYLSMIPKLGSLYEDYIYHPLCMPKNDDDE